MTHVCDRPGASGRPVRAHLPSPCAPRQQRPGRIIGPLTLSDQNQSSRSGPRRGSGGGTWSGRLCRSGANAGQADLCGRFDDPKRIAVFRRSSETGVTGYPERHDFLVESSPRIELARERYRKPVLPSGSPTSSRPRSGIETVPALRSAAPAQGLRRRWERPPQLGGVNSVVSAAQLAGRQLTPLDRAIDGGLGDPRPVPRCVECAFATGCMTPGRRQAWWPRSH